MCWKIGFKIIFYMTNVLDVSMCVCFCVCASIGVVIYVFVGILN